MRVGEILDNGIHVKRENMGKVEKQEVVQFVWSIKCYAEIVVIKGHLSDTTSDLESD